MQLNKKTVVSMVAAATVSVVAVGVGWYSKRKAAYAQQETEQAQIKHKQEKYDRDGYDEHGFDRQGYDRYGYSPTGIDRVGQTRQFYGERFEHLQSTIEKAWSQFNNNELGYALYDTRRVLEETIEQCIMHFCGKTALEKSIWENINKCQNKKLLGKDLVARIHRARKDCNTDTHEFESQIDQQAVQQAISSVQELVEVAFDSIVFSGQ